MNRWMSQIESDLSWREAELASLKKSYLDQPINSLNRTALLRALWALLYAHYEGFCKFALDLYLTEISRNGRTRSEHKTTIAKLSLFKELQEFKNSMPVGSLFDFCHTAFLKLMNKKIEFSVKWKGTSNLWPEMLEENLLLAGLPMSQVDQHRAKLKLLVGRRNEIAHGKKMVIKNLDEYKYYEDAAYDVMHEVALGVTESLDKSEYLHSVNP